VGLLSVGPLKRDCGTIETMKGFLKVIVVVGLLAGAYYGYIFYTGKSLGGEMGPMATVFLERLSSDDVRGAYSMTTDGFKVNATEERLSHIMWQMFGRREFAGQTQTGYSYFKGVVEVPPGDVFEKAWLYEYYGILTFADGTEGDFTIAFAKVDDEWKAHHFDITMY